MSVKQTAPRRRHTLRFPFQLPPYQVISGLDASVERRLGRYNLTLKYDPPFYVMEITGFASEKTAKACRERIWAALRWVLLTCGLSASATLELDDVVYADDPEEAARNLSRSFGGVSFGERVDGLVDGHRPAVYPTDKRMRFITMGTPSLTIGVSVDNFCSVFAEGYSFRNNVKVCMDSKLMTALDLYAAYFVEQSNNARFLTLVMALETLTPTQPKHEVALQMLDQWKGQLESEKMKYGKQSAEYEALESLDRELLFRKVASLRSQICQGQSKIPHLGL